MTKTLRSGTQPGSSDTGRRTLIRFSVCISLNEVIRAEGLVGGGGQRSKTVHSVHEEKTTRGRETETGKERVMCLLSQTAGAVSLELGHANSETHTHTHTYCAIPGDRLVLPTCDISIYHTACLLFSVGKCCLQFQYPNNK